jgi:poly-gamma-glutamate synthase PgsB/CapB
MDSRLLVAAGTALLTGAGLVDSWLHRKALQSIPIRIHVSGTRDKSGVTRLIAAGLRAGGIRACAKTTGTAPRIIFPDGSEYPVFRPSRANVIEQLRVVRTAAQVQADALVLESIAPLPALGALSEFRLVQATHGVITHVRSNPQDVRRSELTDVARTLAGSVPVAGRLYTAEQRHLALLKKAAVDRSAEVIQIADDDVASVSWDELDEFPYVEHPDNVALALKVCADLGVDRLTALQGMWQAEPDPGVMTVYRAEEPGQSIVFINGFSANDLDSTGRVWPMVVRRYGQHRQRVAIVNCRADRADRTRQLAESCLTWSPAERYVVVGTGTRIFSQRVMLSGMDPDRLTCLENVAKPQLLETVQRIAGNSALLLGMGNISGAGLDLVQHFRKQHIAAAATRSRPAKRDHPLAKPLRKVA